MAFFLSPLVHVNEIDLTTTIPAVAEHIGVSILRNTWKGAEKKTHYVSSTNQLIKDFGMPTDTASCYEDIITAATFLKTADMLYCTRVLSDLATFAGTRMPSGGENSCDAYTVDTALTFDAMFNEDSDYFGETNIASDHSIVFIAKDRGAWGNRIRIAVLDKTNQDYLISRDASGPYGDGSPTADGGTQWETHDAFASADARLQDNDEFLLVVQYLEQNELNTTPNWENVEYFVFSFNENKTDDVGNNIFAENIINNQSEYIRVNIKPSYANQTFLLSNSSWQTFAGGADSNGDSVSDGDIIEAIDLYSDPEEIDVNLFIDSNKSETVKSYIISTCELNGGRGDCMAILDCKKDTVVDNRGNEALNLVQWRRGLSTYSSDNLNENTSYAAVYGNWAEVYDKWNQKYRWIPLSGHVGAAYAYTDAVADAWYAPAGLNRGILQNIRRLAWNPKKGDRDLLYMNGINPITAFAGQGKVIWGQKTLLDKPSAFNRVNVRRLFLILEKAISTASKYFIFEPNTEATRLQLINMIEPFLRDVKSREGVYDYLVVCDSTNNTPERIDRNELWCDIYIKPVRAAEFIVLNFIATKTGADFSEIAALRAA